MYLDILFNSLAKVSHCLCTRGRLGADDRINRIEMLRVFSLYTSSSFIDISGCHPGGDSSCVVGAGKDRLRLPHDLFQKKVIHEVHGLQNCAGENILQEKFPSRTLVFVVEEFSKMQDTTDGYFLSANESLAARCTTAAPNWDLLFT